MSDNEIFDNGNFGAGKKCWSHFRKRIGEPTTTFTGLQFYALDPRPEEINILDIAHSLSLSCRFGGMCNDFYSVAEHCVILCDYFLKQGKPWLAYQALMHDAAEAYFFGDVRKPLKSSLGKRYSVQEEFLERMICKKYGVSFPFSKEVKDADFGIFITERTALFHSGTKWAETGKPLDVKLHMWPPKRAEQEFLKRFGELS